MSAPKIIDVSLRDGGHLNNFDFTSEQLSTIITALDQSGIDYIEVGYRNGSISPIEDIGVAGLCPDQYLRQCRTLMMSSKMAVMAHCENINETDIKSMKSAGVSLLRLCVKKGRHQEALATIELAKKHQLHISVNLIHSSQYVENTLYEAVEQLSTQQPLLIYFADSNGAMHPERVKEIFARCKSEYPALSFGFHAHNNLGLAQTNSITAVSEGATYIDASLAGMGKGMGNLALEFYIAYLHSMGHSKYGLSELINASNYLRKNIIKYGLVTQGEFLRGIKDMSTKQMHEYLSQVEGKS
jgi:4-hydroxy 2-oxovalerate aldolase